jgi:hypothetical protein
MVSVAQKQSVIKNSAEKKTICFGKNITGTKATTLETALCSSSGEYG